MIRFLLTSLILLSLAATASAAHRSLFGIREGVRTRVVTRERIVQRVTERGPILPRLRGGAGCAGVATTGAGCGGFVGPALAPPMVPRVLPMPMVPHKK